MPDAENKYAAVRTNANEPYKIKRKREESAHRNVDGTTTSAFGDVEVDAISAGRIKQKAAKKVKKASDRAEDANIDENLQINNNIGRMDRALLADHAFRQFKKFQPKLTDPELEDVRLPEAAFADTSSWPKIRKLEDMHSFINSFAGASSEQLSQAPSINGAPHTIVVCSAAMRAADATRALRCYQSKEATVGKLFAKHIKLKEAIEFTKKTRMTVGVGTPQRLLDLHEAGALSIQCVQRIVIDGSWSGAKKRTLFEQVDAVLPMMRFLAKPEFRSRYMQTGDQQLSILVY